MWTQPPGLSVVQISTFNESQRGGLSNLRCEVSLKEAAGSLLLLHSQSFSPRCRQSLSAAWREANTRATLWVKCQDMARSDSARNLPWPLEITKPGALESPTSIPVTPRQSRNLQRASGETTRVDRSEEGFALNIDFLRSGRRLAVYTHLLDTILTYVTALKRPLWWYLGAVTDSQDLEPGSPPMQISVKWPDWHPGTSTTPRKG